MFYMSPPDRRYSREHEWVKDQADGTVAIGITDYAQNELGDVVFVELPSLGSQLAQMQAFGVVESVKAVSDLYCPVTGRVVAINPDLEVAPEKVNDDPFGAGWMIRVEFSDPAEIDQLLDADAYDALLDELRA